MRSISPVAVRPQYDARHLLDLLLEATENAAKKQCLHNVWAALEHLRVMRVNDFTVAGVARAVEAMGMDRPKLQSMRNREGRHFRELIAKYSEEHGKPTKPIPQRDLASSIPDLRTAARVRELLNENRSLKWRLDLLKHEFASLAPTPEHIVCGGRSDSRRPDRVAAEESAFTPREIASAREFMKNVQRHSQETGLAFEPASGALLYREGIIEMAGPGMMQALLKIAGTPT